MMVTDQDYELLSGYIDNALPPDERQALEARLAAEPTLRAELEALRGTVALLRGMPVFKAPRDFTLTPAMVARPEPALEIVPKRRAQPFYLSPVFSAAAAAAAFLLVALSTVLLNLDSPLRESAPAAVALQATVVSDQVQVLSTATMAAGDTMAGAAVALPTQTDDLEQESQDVLPATVDPGAMMFSSEAASTALPEAGMLMAPAGAADAAQEEALTFTPEIAAPLNFASPAGTPPPPVDGIITESAADSAPATASVAREGDLSTVTPAPTQPAMLAATMAPQGTPVAVLPPAEAAPVPSPTTTTTSSSPFVPLVLLGAGILLGLLAILTTLLRRRAN